MTNDTPAAIGADALPEFNDPRVNLVYDLLCECDENGKPENDHWEGWIARRIVAALASAAQPAVPPGYVLVPVEPTQEMLDVGRWSGAGSVSVQEEWARRVVWRRMLAAAPKAAPAPTLSDSEIEALAVEHEAFGFGQVDARGLTTHGFDPSGLHSFVRALFARGQALAPAAVAEPSDAEIDALCDQFRWDTTQGRRALVRASIARWRNVPVPTTQAAPAKPKGGDCHG